MAIRRVLPARCGMQSPALHSTAVLMMWLCCKIATLTFWVLLRATTTLLIYAHNLLQLSNRLDSHATLAQKGNLSNSTKQLDRVAACCIIHLLLCANIQFQGNIGCTWV